MPIMCEECKCSIYLEDKPDGTRDYGGCENGCACCNQDLSAAAAVYEKLLAIPEDDREEGNPIQFAEEGPNRFHIMSLFFSNEVDGIRIQEDVDLGEITVSFFSEGGEIELKEGLLYDWALDRYHNHW